MKADVKTVIIVDNDQIDIIDDYYPVPVGGIVQLSDPNRDYMVILVRLEIFGTKKDKITLCLDCIPLPLGSYIK